MEEPQNELGLIVLFAQQCQSRGIEIASIQKNYPDAVITDQNGQAFRIEFEFQASSFHAHRHDPRKCDAIVCWANDGLETILPVIELCDSDWQMIHPESLASETEKEAEYWKQRALYAEWQLTTLKTQASLTQSESVKQNTESNSELDLGPTYRRRELLNIWRDYPQVTQEQLATRFNVSRQTISKDFIELTQAGKVQRNGRGVEVLESATGTQEGEL